MPGFLLALLSQNLRIFDIRLALTLRRQGVSEFATANAKDFEGLGFQWVWNPLAG